MTCSIVGLCNRDNFAKKIYFLFNPLYTGNSLTGILANSEDPDEMQQNAAFHQGLYCLLRLDRNTSYFRNFYQLPLKIQNGQSHTYCSKGLKL